jgi:hypothetical protein
MANIVSEYAMLPARFGLKGMTDRLRDESGHAEIRGSFRSRVEFYRFGHEQATSWSEVDMDWRDSHDIRSIGRSRGVRAGESPPRSGEGEQ